MEITAALEILTAQHDEIETLATTVSSAADPTVRNLILCELADKLTLHLGVEHEIVYPIADPLITTEVRAEMAAEHAEIKRVLADLVWLEQEDQRFARKLTSLQLLLQWHQVWQEAELFERIVTHLTPDELIGLGNSVEAWLVRTALAIAA